MRWVKSWRNELFMASAPVFLDVHRLPESYLPFIRRYGLDTLIEKHEYYHHQLDDEVDSFWLFRANGIEFVAHRYGLINEKGLLLKHLSVSVDRRFATLLLDELQLGESEPNEIVLITQHVPELSCYVATFIHYTHGRQLTYPTPLT